VIVVVVAALVVTGVRSWHHAAGPSTAGRTDGSAGSATPRPKLGARVVGRAPSSTEPPSTEPSSTEPTNTEPTSRVASSTVGPKAARPKAHTTVDGGGRGVLTERAIKRYLESCGDNITASVYDLRTGRTSYWRPGVTEDEASISKVDILAALLHKEGAIDGDDVGNATAMIEDSDDTAANNLWLELGEGTAEAVFNRKIGLTDTAPGPGIDWGLTTTTAADQVRLLRAVVGGTRLLSAASRRLELNLMEHVEPSEQWGVSSGVQGATLAIKNGWLPLEDADWQINSIGWVDGHGRDYIIAVLTDDNTTEYQGISTIEGLANRVWSAGG
jgi:hypothetical protein